MGVVVGFNVMTRTQPLVYSWDTIKAPYVVADISIIIKELTWING